MHRLMFPLLVATLLLPARLTPTVDGHADLPVTVISCERDPGTVSGPQGRDPGYFEREFGCHPVSGVGVTASSVALGYQDRCDTGSDGRCSFSAPSSPDTDIQVAVHTAMLPPGEEPREAVVSTRNETEFRGAEIVILPDPQAGAPATRQVLSVTLTGCGAAACTAGDVLAQVSPADITSRDAAWLAPDDSGLVTFDLGRMESEAVDLMLNVDGRLAISCTDDTSGAAVTAQWMDEREGTFARIAVPAGASVSCAVAMDTAP